MKRNPMAVYIDTDVEFSYIHIAFIGHGIRAQCPDLNLTSNHSNEKEKKKKEKEHFPYSGHPNVF